MPDESQMTADYSAIPKVTQGEYEHAQKFSAVRMRALEFTNEELLDALGALGLASR